MRRVTSVLASRSGRALLGFLAALALAIAALVSPATARSAPSVTPQPITLKVAEFNTEYAGIHVSFDKVIQAIRRGGADVVGLEEAQGHTARIARALGWPYYSPRLQILSRFPIIDPPGGNSIYVLIEAAPGQVVAIENVHLPSNPYGPFWVKQGYSRADVLAKEHLRLRAVRPSLHAARGLVAQGIPVFLTGDFNTPSWRDWTPQMVGVRYQIRYAVKWPVSVAVERAGFVDSYREVHPSPLQDPGLTWWADRPRLRGWNPGRHAAEDRIDFVYAAGTAQATQSIIVGERGHEGVDVGVSPWPSDHRSTVSTFEVTPSPMPALVAVQRRLLPVGKDVVTTFHTPGVGGEQVAVVPAGGDPATDTIDDQPTGAAVDGTLAFPTGMWQPGDYDAVLLDGAGGELSRIAFWLKAPGTGPVISTDMSSYAIGEPIEVTWSNTRGERWDWIGVYPREEDPRAASYLLWTHTGATVEGSLMLDDFANGPFPLAAGDYRVSLFRDDGYVRMAHADFTVTG
jgi:endonuclease/exonuclease/phosphatase family metal-dependent hydrolase